MRTARSLAVFLLLLGGCEQNSASLIILQNQIPGEGCGSGGTGDDTSYRTQGTLDVAWYLQKHQPAYYDMYLLVKNNLQSTESDYGVEENCLTIRNALVDLDLGSLSQYVESTLTRYKVPVSLSICPEEQRVVTVRVVVPQVVELIAPRVPEGTQLMAVATVALEADRGSYTIESNELSYPIFICNGCLVRNVGLCDSPVVPDEPAAGNPCNPSQDDPIDCCTSGSDLICPAVSTSDAT